MAKMKICDITRSLQEKYPDLKSKDLIKLLNENGYEAKAANSSIEDEAIGFLLKQFSNPATAPVGAKASEKKAPKKAPKKEETVVVAEEKTEEKVRTSSLEEEKAAKKPEEAVAEKRQPEETKSVSAKEGNSEKKEAKPEAAKENRPQENRTANRPDNRPGYNNRGNDNRGGDNRNRRSNNGGNRYEDRNNNNNGGDRRNNQTAYNRQDNGRRFDNNRNGAQGGRGNNDRRGGSAQGGQGTRDNRNRRQGGSGVIERFEKSQSGIDAIKPEIKQSRTQRAGKPDNKRYNKDRDFDRELEDGFGKDASRRNKKKDPNRKGAFIKPEPVVTPKEEEGAIKTIIIPEKLTLKELADKMKVAPAAVVKKLFLQGQVVSINHEMTFEEAEEIALEYNCIAELEEKVDVIAELLKEEEEAPETLKKRPPVVCVMGHVDHGKTSLLDAIRESNVTSREAGGITQHIGAYVVESNGEKITFLDTPGHEAFTSMRMRGAKSTDIAILVVAADDGVMPQTVEAINHAKAAGVEIIVAVNKIDKPSANIERVKQELVEHELIAEDWGGTTIFVPVSAHTKEGIDQLLEMILLTSEVLELKANPDRRARGIVIEAQLDKGRGPVATILVQKGTLHVGDHIVIGSAYGKVRAMMDDKGQRVKTATPSTPVEIFGLNEVPNAGEVFMAQDNEKEARSVAEAYINQGKERLLADTKSKLSLEGLFSQIQAGNIKELNIIVKADVQGSVEAVKQSLLKLSNEEVVVRVIHAGVGAITESDVSLASASNAIIIGFNIRPDNMAKEIADREKVDVRLYKVIYNAIEDVEAAMKGMQEPVYEEKVIGHAEVRQTFKASGVGVIAGSYVLDGKVVRNCKVRISREGEQIFEGDLASLKRFKDDVKEVSAGYECGFVFEGFNGIQVEDQIEAYIMEEVPR